MTSDERRTRQILTRLDRSWTAFRESYAGLSDSDMLEPGVTGDWSVKDILAHVTTWEEEALKFLPLIMRGERPPLYKTYGGIDAFNARMWEEKRGLSLDRVRRAMEETHASLVRLVEGLPADHLGGGTRVRRRLRLDTYGHYPEHTQAITEWRARRGL